MEKVIKERPILFSAPMVRAILDGTKTMTRRVVKPQPPPTHAQVYCNPYNNDYGAFTFWTKEHKMVNGWAGNVKGTCHWKCPYGSPGDRLWVRETWAHAGRGGDTIYKASFGEAKTFKWKPSIHMFRRDSRILLEVTAVRVERLRDIGEEDARAEGGVWTDNGPRAWCKPGAVFEEANKVNGWNEGWSHEGKTDQRECLSSARWSFANLWNKINGPESWNANPWVWVVEFKRITEGRKP
jgi:hypothetical protein